MTRNMPHYICGSAYFARCEGSGLFFQSAVVLFDLDKEDFQFKTQTKLNHPIVQKFIKVPFSSSMK